VTQWSEGTSASDYETHYAVYYDNAGTFTATNLTDISNRPRSAAYDGSRIGWRGRNGIYRFRRRSCGNAPSGAGLESPVLAVYYDSVNGVLMAGGG
jgi:hypothetical protein